MLCYDVGMSVREVGGGAGLARECHRRRPLLLPAPLLCSAKPQHVPPFLPLLQEFHQCVRTMVGLNEDVSGSNDTGIVMISRKE